ncbi:MAG: hypothetical protein K6B52_02345 [Clostridiales bacterium]|nr:hypothetical protein [Clostridiales bacterium]
MNKINVISHRGANRRAPQNTIPAFKKSLEIGVDGFETDVHLTKDNIPVICHNYDIDETSTGKGLICEKTYDELKEYDFGSYFSSVYSGVTLPLLTEFLEICASSDIKVMNIELKEPKDGKTDIVEKTISLVKEYNLFDRLLISSFSPELLVHCKSVDPATKTGFLYSPDKKIFYESMLTKYVEYAQSIKADYLHPHYSMVSPTYVDLLHQAGIGVNPWTVNNESDVKKMIKCGVDGIITDVPDEVKCIIAEYNE